MNQSIGMRIKHMSNLIEKKAYSIFSSDGYQFISQSGFAVLDLLYRNKDKEVTQKDIETEMVINRATTSKMLLLLEEKGLIVRVGNKSDARRKSVILTEAGEQLHNHNHAKQAEFDKIIADALSEDDLKAFDKIYEKLRIALDG